MLVETITKDTEDLNNTVSVFDLTSIYTLQNSSKIYIFLKCTWNFLGKDRMLGEKKRFNKFK